MDPIRTEEVSHAPRAEVSPEPQRILAATDLGPVGDETVRVAHARGGRLAICHVIEDVPKDPDEAQRRVAEVRGELARDLHALFGDAADDIELFVLTGDAARQIHDCAEAWSAELVVLGRPEHADSILARLFHPHVVDKVVRWAPCAVLVTRRAPGTRRIVVGVDFTDPAREVLRRAAVEQARTGASVYAVHCLSPAATFPIGDPVGGVMPPPDWDAIERSMTERLVAAAAEAQVSAAPQLVHDGAADGLVQIARDLAADLVIVGTHARSGLARLALGSVALHVVKHAPCPVMVVRLG